MIFFYILDGTADYDLKTERRVNQYYNNNININMIFKNI